MFHPVKCPVRGPTPFGITDYIGCRVCGCTDERAWCSTPFGITDYIGPGPRPHRARARRGAQRLSASRIISVGDGCAGAADVLCSTPFGITDYIGRDGQMDRLVLSVCSTPFGITDYIGYSGVDPGETPRVRCAQRLSASRIISAARRRAMSSISRRCAQRLSASRIISDGQRVGPQAVEECSTPFGITDYIGCRQARRHRRGRVVLNAFRHHGLYRRAAGGAGRRDGRVLNAFRHHGLYRALGGQHVGGAMDRCSTPFGITDYIGRRTRREGQYS